MIKVTAALLAVLLMAPCAWANGGPYHFETVLAQVDNDWNGFNLFYLGVNAGHIEFDKTIITEFYDITYLIPLDDLESKLKKSFFIHSPSGKIFLFTDFDYFKRVKADEDRILEKYLVFKQKELNKGNVLAMVPISRDGKKTPSVSVVKVNLENYKFLKNPSEDVIIDFVDAFDMDNDKKEDVLVFMATINLTRTYILGRKGNDWRILHIQLYN